MTMESAKNRARLRRRAWPWLTLVAALALWLTACGSPAVGDVEGQVLAMRDAGQQPALLKGANVVLAGNRVDCGKRSDHCVALSDDQGKYRFADVPAGDYGIAFSVQPKEGETRLQPENREFNVSPRSVETVSVVLLAEGIARPTPPPDLAQRGQAARNDPGLSSNPFFWYWMFNQPWLFGYSRPPVVVYAPGPERTVIVDRSQPSTPAAPGRTYSSYGPPGTQGTKPAPVAVESKGVTRPGGSAAVGGNVVTGSGSGATGSGSSATTRQSDPSTDSKGVARPGQSSSGASGAASSGGSGSAASSGSSSGSSGSGAVSRPSQPSSPPRVGAGGGSTAGRSPSSSRPSSPPRVSGGRR